MWLSVLGYKGVQNSHSWCVVFVVWHCYHWPSAFCQQSHCNDNVAASDVFRECWTYRACFVTAVSTFLRCLSLQISRTFCSVIGARCDRLNTEWISGFP
jgi:hypothetical protein